MENNKFAKLKSIIALMQNDTVTPDVLRGFLQNVLNTIKENKEVFEDISKQTIAEVSKALEYIQVEHETFMQNVKDEAGNVYKKSDELEKRIKEVKKLCNEMKDCMPKDGENGKDADEEYVIESVLAKIPKPKEVVLDNAEKIRDKLETLEGESRLDASAIKNLPEFIKDDKRIGFGSMLKEAPKDGLIYGRQNRTWVEVTSGSGTVTSVSVVSVNGFSGSVANATTTPAITIGTSITGLLYGDGTALKSVAVSNGLTYSAGTLKWGGALTADTTISGAYNLSFTGLTSTTFNGTEFTITGSNDVMYANSANKIFRAGDFNGSTAKLNITPGTGIFEIKANTTFQLKTPAVVAGTATVGQVLQLTNATTGASEWTTISTGSGTVNSGTQYQMAFYNATGTAVSGNSGIVTDALNMLAITSSAGTGTLNAEFQLNSAAHTSLTASTEYSSFVLNGAVTQQFATGALTNQRYARIAAPTYSFVGASTIQLAATLAISGAPIRGTNATINNSIGLWIQSNAVGTVVEAAGAFIEAPTGGTSNYSLVLGGSGTTSSLRVNSTAGNAIEIQNGNGVEINMTGTGNSQIRSSATGEFDIYTSSVPMYFSTNNLSAIAMNITSNKLFVGANTAATAKLHIAAGSATANTAPLKFTSGTLNTTAEAGAMEFLSEKFYLTPTSTARASVPGVLFTQTSSTTVANTVTETTIIGSGVGSVTLPANFFVAGKTIRLRGYGFHSTTGSPTVRLRIKLGSTTILDTTAINSHVATNAQVDWEGIITCRTTGATGTVIGQGFYQEFQNPDVSIGMVNTTTTTIDTTSSLAVNATIEWGTADVGNTITVTNLILEVLN